MATKVNFNNSNEFYRVFTEFSVAYSQAKREGNNLSLYRFLTVRKLHDQLTRLYTPFSQSNDVVSTAYQKATTKADKLSKSFFESAKTTLISLSRSQNSLVFGIDPSSEELNCFDLDFVLPGKRFEFDGIFYPSARHAFLAQMYRGKPDLQKRCAECQSKEELFKFVANQGNPSESEWYKPHAEFGQYRAQVMYHVLRAKFGQLESLGHTLQQTLDTHLVYRAKEDNFWNTDNRLGRLMVKVRHELGGLSASEGEDRLSLANSNLPSKIAGLNKTSEQIKSEIVQLNREASEEVYERETGISRKQENLPFNSWVGVNYIFNKTLVALPSGQYINANFLYGNLLIATQAPMNNTTSHFFEMIFENKSPAALMLNMESDVQGRVYWPHQQNETRKFGDFEVRLVSEPEVIAGDGWSIPPYEENFHGIIKRILEVKKGDVVHTVVHFQYLGMRDRGIGHVQCTARLANLLKEVHGDLTKPVVVHCYAGVGRTAAFAAIYEQFLRWKSGAEIDVRGSVAAQRHPDTGRYYKMVEADIQYSFIYETLKRMCF